MLSYTQNAHAASCSPGIPCTDANLSANWNLYDGTNWNAGHDSGLNGPKSGVAPADYSESTCDGNFMNQIYSKAYMEGSRQVMMSEQIIHKPDSVLEYTCFDGWVDHAATVASEFSETTRWADDYEQDRETADETITDTFDVNREDFNDDDTNCPPGGDPEECADDLAEALEWLIDDVLETYLQNNFDHTYLGEAISVDYAAGGGVGCSDMSTVWNIAKCLDFGEDDRFRTFQDLIDHDPRSIPEECSSGHSSSDVVEAGSSGTKLDNTTPGSVTDDMSDLCPPTAGAVAGVNTGFSADIIRMSNNCPDPSDDDNKHAYSADDLIELKDYLLLGAGDGSGLYIPGTAGSSSGIVTCAPPVPTGIPVITYEHEATGRVWVATYFLTGVRRRYIHYEYVCPNPGCFYRPIKVLLPEAAAPISVILNFNDFVSANGIGACIPY